MTDSKARDAEASIDATLAAMRRLREAASAIVALDNPEGTGGGTGGGLRMAQIARAALTEEGS